MNLLKIVAGAWVAVAGGVAVPAGAVSDDFIGTPGEAGSGWHALVYAGEEAEGAAAFERALARDPASREALEGAAWLDFTHGRLGRAFERWQAYLERYPESEEALAFVATVRFFDGVVPAFEEAPDFLLALAARPDCPPATREVARRTAEQLLVRFGRWEAAADLAEAQGYVDDVAACGIFNRYGVADLDHRFGPEEKLTAAPAVTLGEAGWRPVEGRFGRLDVEGALGFNFGVAYLTTAFDLPAGEYLLEIQGDDWFRAYVGGTEVLANHPATAPSGSVHRGRFATPGGPQRLLLKTIKNNDGVYTTDGEWALKIRLLRAADLRAVAVAADASDLASAGVPAVAVAAEPSAEPAGTMDEFYRAFELYAAGAYVEGVAHMNAAAAAAPSCALFAVAGAYGRILAGGEHNLADAKSQLRRARAEDPACVVATEELAVFASYEGKREEAVDYYRETLAAEPAFVSSACGLGDVAAREGWEPELLRQAERALTLNPQAHRALLLLAEYFYDNDNTVAAVPYYERYVGIRADDADARAALAEAYLFLGQADSAESQYRQILAVDAYNEAAYLGLADLAARRGEVEAARGWFAEGAKRLPRSAELRRQWGYYLCGRGEREEGLAVLREAAALDVSDYETRYYVRRESGLPPDAVARAVEVDVDRLLARAAEAAGYPHADAVMLLDQSIVYLNNDFTFRESNHNLIAIMNDAGRERWGEITVMSDGGTEIKDARTHLLDGGVVDAVSIKNSNGYKVISMERVVPGATLEVAYDLNLNRRMVFNLLQYYSQPFFMAELGEALRWTRFGVVVADDFPARDRLDFAVENGGIKARRVRGDGRTAYLFERREVPALVEETFMPSRDAFAPYVRLSTLPDAATVAEWYRGELCGKFRVDDYMRARLAALDLPAGSEAELAAALYYYVVREIESSGGSVYYPAPARLTLFRGRGRTVDRAVLLVALARELGLEAKLALVGTGGSKGEWEHITPDLFDSVLVYFPTLGPEGIFADPLLDTFAFGDVWTAAYGKPALLVDDGGYEIGRVPAQPFEKDSIALELDLELDYRGGATFRGRRAYRGLRGAYRDNFRDPENRDSNVEISLARIFAAATIDSYDFENLTDLEGEFALLFEGSVPSFARLRGDTLAVRVVPYEFTLAQVFIASEKRQYPLRVERPEAWMDEVRVKIPAGYRVEWKPHGVRLAGPHSEYSLEVEAEGDALLLRRRLVIDQGDISVRDYKKFVKFCRQVDRVEKEEILLVPKALGDER